MSGWTMLAIDFMILCAFICVGVALLGKRNR